MSEPRVIVPALLAVSLERAKKHIRETVGENAIDEDVADAILGAQDHAEHYAQRSFMKRTLQVSVDAFQHCGAIRLDYPPILGVVSVEYRNDDGDFVVLSPSAYSVDTVSAPGWVVPAYGYSWPAARGEINAVRVTYEAGYSDSDDVEEARAAVPPAARSAILCTLAYLYQHRGDADVEMPRAARALLDRVRVYG